MGGGRFQVCFKAYLKARSRIYPPKLAGLPPPRLTMMPPSIKHYNDVYTSEVIQRSSGACRTNPAVSHLSDAGDNLLCEHLLVQLGWTNDVAAGNVLGIIVTGDTLDSQGCGGIHTYLPQQTEGCGLLLLQSNIAPHRCMGGRCYDLRDTALACPEDPQVTGVGPQTAFLTRRAWGRVLVTRTATSMSAVCLMSSV